MNSRSKIAFIHKLRGHNGLNNRGLPAAVQNAICVVNGLNLNHKSALLSYNAKSIESITPHTTEPARARKNRNGVSATNKALPSSGKSRVFLQNTRYQLVTLICNQAHVRRHHQPQTFVALASRARSCIVLRSNLSLKSREQTEKMLIRKLERYFDTKRPPVVCIQGK